MDTAGATPFHAETPEVVAAVLGTDLATGLSPDEAAARLARDGPNELDRPRRPAYLRLALAQVADPLVALLAGAAVVSTLVGERVEAGVIGAIVVLNAAFGLWQEAGAERAVLALRAAIVSEIVVVRDGLASLVPTRALVVGDLVRLREGDRVPADVRVVTSLGLEVDESALTGESVPVAKAWEPVPAETPLAERASVAYAGTSVTRGAGHAIVFAVGARTEQGAIVAMTEEAQPPPTPLQQRLGRLARRLVLLGVSITLLLTAAMLLRGEGLEEAFLVGVSVAVAAVPEGLAATVTIALALGAREMARRGAVVRTLSAIETIGEATVVCADKTGTLTVNRLRVARVEPARGAARGDLLAAALAAAEAEVDPVDGALAAAARAEGVPSPGRVVRSIPFEAGRRRATVVVDGPDGQVVIVKGAPETVLALAGGDCEPELARTAVVWAENGLRVLALAARHYPPGVRPSDDELEDGLESLGIVGLEDPLRPGAAESIRQARSAGLGVRMLTGDHPATARAIGRAIGLDDPEIRARCTPAEKLELVKELAADGEIVVVTGDGVNDAPALRQAHVGVAMGRGGTEAAREAAAIVLTDDDFSTIVAAVREGRRIGGNVRSFLAFLLSANIGEVALFAVAIVAGLGTPMTVVQVLVVNLLTDGPPAIALARDPAGEAAFSPGRALLGRTLGVALALFGALIGLVALIAFLVVDGLEPGGAQTAAFATIALAELALVFSCRSEREAAWRLPRNGALEVAVLVSLTLVLLAVYLPVLHDPLGTVSLGPAALALVVALALVPAVCVESVKAVRRVQS